MWIYVLILSSYKNEWNISIFSNMDGPREYCAQWNKTDRERQILYDVTYMCNLKNNTNESILKMETDL